MKIRQQAKRQIETRLLSWFSKHKREMPWRSKKSAYGTLVSEVMLQQTQIKTVIPYYNRWMKQFPTFESFAKAPIDLVLKSWEGLGYYSRARNLHKTAQIIVTNFGGKIPQDVETLMSLPGIGRYTAGAIASIAFNVSAPIVDGNVARVLSRIFYIKKDIVKPDTQNELYAVAAELVSKSRPGDFNQALMELGSLICFPLMPQCSGCPVRSFCKAHSKNKQETLPIKSNSLKRKKIHITAAMIRKNGALLIQKRDAKGIWGGLWEFPNVVSVQKTDLETVKKEFENKFHFALKKRSQKHPSFVHKLTHMDTLIHCYEFEATTDSKHLANGAIWADSKKISELSFPVPFRNILQND